MTGSEPEVEKRNPATKGLSGWVGSGTLGSPSTAPPDLALRQSPTPPVRPAGRCTLFRRCKRRPGRDCWLHRSRQSPSGCELHPRDIRGNRTHRRKPVALSTASRHWTRRSSGGCGPLSDPVSRREGMWSISSASFTAAAICRHSLNKGEITDLARNLVCHSRRESAFPPLHSKARRDALISPLSDAKVFGEARVISDVARWETLLIGDYSYQRVPNALWRPR